MINVHHDPEGFVFRKYTGSEGISYLSVDADTISVDNPYLLVRHGQIESGHCGYYPLKALYQDKETRERIALSQGKRPPTEGWVRRTRKRLEVAGLVIGEEV